MERAAGTFQDRLVTELRLAGAKTINQANPVLRDFLPRYNAQFAVPAELPEPAYRPWISQLPLDEVLCFKHPRKVARNNTVKYQWRTLQLLPSAERPSYAGARGGPGTPRWPATGTLRERDHPQSASAAPSRCAARFPRRPGSQSRNQPRREASGQPSPQPTPVTTPGQSRT